MHQNGILHGVGREYEEAIWEAENGNELFNFDWDEYDHELVEIKEQEIPELQLTLSGVLV